MTAYICQHSDQYPYLAEAFLESQCLAFNSIAKIDELTDRRHLTLFRTGTLDDPSIILTQYNYLSTEYRDQRIAINYLTNIFQIRTLRREITQTYLPLLSACPLLSYLEFFIIVRHTKTEMGKDYFLKYYESLIEDLERCEIMTQLEGELGERGHTYYLRLNDATLPFFYFNELCQPMLINRDNFYKTSTNNRDLFSFFGDEIKEFLSFQDTILAVTCKIIDEFTSTLPETERKRINTAFHEFFSEPLEHYLSPTKTPGLYLQFESEKSLRVEFKTEKQTEYYRHFFDLYNKKYQSAFFLKRRCLPPEPSWQQIFDHAIEKPNSRTAQVLSELGLDFNKPGVREFFVEKEETELDDTSDYFFGSSSQ